MLKPAGINPLTQLHEPAAFGRLCVETTLAEVVIAPSFPAAFGRLCVETVLVEYQYLLVSPAAFGRLCVETRAKSHERRRWWSQPPSGGCVLKPKTGDKAAEAAASRLRAAVC